MLLENVIAALQNAKTVACVFPGSAKEYTYKIPADWEVVTGDILVVDSPTNGLVLVTVVQVHAEADIDPTASFVYKWAVSKVDTQAYKERVVLEKQYAKQLKELQKRASQAKLLKSLIEELGEDAKDIIAAIQK